MSERLNSAAVAEKAIVHAELPRARGAARALFERSEPTLAEAIATYRAPDAVENANIRQDVDRTFALYLGFIAILGVGLSTPELAIPMAIFAIFIVGLFGAPALWLGLGRKPEAKAKSFGELMRGGIQTHTGFLKGRDAVAQMMVLPVLIVLWGCTVLVIAGVVSA